jgi:hypothetical protein
MITLDNVNLNIVTEVEEAFRWYCHLELVDRFSYLYNQTTNRLHELHNIIVKIGALVMANLADNFDMDCVAEFGGMLETLLEERQDLE